MAAASIGLVFPSRSTGTIARAAGNGATAARSAASNPSSRTVAGWNDEMIARVYAIAAVQTLMRAGYCGYTTRCLPQLVSYIVAVGDRRMQVQH